MSQEDTAEYRERVEKVLGAVQLTDGPEARETAIAAIMALMERAWQDGWDVGYESGNDGEPYMP